MAVTYADAAGRLVAELIDEYKDRIAAAKDRNKVLLAPHKDNPDIDDLFLLRYCLSYNNDKKLDEAVVYRFKYYEDMQNREMMELGRAGKWLETKAGKYMAKHLVGGFYSTTVAGAPIFWARPGVNHQIDVVIKGMLAEGITTGDLRRHLICIREYMYWACDRITRSTGVLTKSIMITDLKKLTAAHVMQRELTEANSAASNASAKLFPQLLLKNLLINPPGFFSWAFGALKKFFSAKALSKIEIYSKSIPLAEQPFVRQWMKLDELPKFVGGPVAEDDLPPEMNGGLLASLAGDKNAITVKIKARDELTVTIPVVAGVPLKVVFDVAAYGVHVQAKVVSGPALKEPPNTKAGQGGQVQILQEIGKKEICGQFKAEYECLHTGHISVLFSNKHSMLRAKDVTYKIWQEAARTDTEVPVNMEKLQRVDMEKLQKQGRQL